MRAEKGILELLIIVDHLFFHSKIGVEGCFICLTGQELRTGFINDIVMTIFFFRRANLTTDNRRRRRAMHDLRQPPPSSASTEAHGAEAG